MQPERPLTPALSPSDGERGVWTFWIGQPAGLPEGSRRSPGVMGAATSGQRRRRSPAPGRGARLVAAEPDRDWRCPRELSWHPSDMGSTYCNLHHHWVCATKNAAYLSSQVGAHASTNTWAVTSVDWRSRLPGSGTPPGCSTIRRGLPVVVPPLP